jgi:sugar O-acyltransferase (sialic acid O-acetyltransferase NeuD family)
MFIKMETDKELKLALFGFGGHAREVASLIGKEVDFFVDDPYSGGLAKPISSFDPEKYLMMIAVGDSIERKRIANSLDSRTRFFTFIHPTAVISGSGTIIGEGSFIGPYSILTTNIKIGKHAILNRGNQIGHDCTIGDYFSAMPGAIISGNVDIGDIFYMGTNSSIKEKISVCDGVKLGMGSSLVKDCTQSGTYVGCPAKKIK